MVSAPEKLVVRVSLGTKALASGDLPEPVTEQQWHWRRILGAGLTLVAALLLLYGWLNVDSPEAKNSTAPEPSVVPIVSAETFDVSAAELVLEVVPQNPEPELVSTETTAAELVTNTTELKAEAQLANLAAEPVSLKAVAALQPETGDPLFVSASGVLRLVLLTNEPPSAKASGLAGQIDASAVSQLALYSEVQGLNGQHIEHLWYYEGKLMTRIKLPVKLDYWRTYSRKEFDINQKGEWRVEILDPQQNLLFSHHFHYQ